MISTVISIRKDSSTWEQKKKGNVIFSKHVDQYFVCLGGLQLMFLVMDGFEVVLASWLKAEECAPKPVQDNGQADILWVGGLKYFEIFILIYQCYLD